MLVTAYRDHASERAMFFGTLASGWSQLGPADRRAHAELIRDRVLERGAAELLLFDGNRVLQAHWADGQWRAPAAGWTR